MDDVLVGLPAAAAATVPGLAVEVFLQASLTVEGGEKGGLGALRPLPSRVRGLVVSAGVARLGGSRRR